MTFKTQIRLEITGPEAELVSHLRDDVVGLLSRRIQRLIELNRGKLVCFTTRTCAAIPDGMSFPTEDQSAEATK